MSHTVEQFRNEFSFVQETSENSVELDATVRIARCEQEPRLTIVRVIPHRGASPTSVYYAVDGKRIENQTAEGIVAALNGGAA